MNMRRILAISLIVSGTIFSLFIFNLIMFATIPEYRSFLTGSVKSEAEIPVVDANGSVIENGSFTMEEDTDSVALNASTESIEARLIELGAADEVPLAENADDAAAGNVKQIVDREYHEDCGTGKGYWVITYDDGSTEVE